MSRIDIHADDYALTVNTSKDLLACMQQGGLDSISIIPNMSCFEKCVELLYAEIPNLPFLPKMSVHLNLMEGHSLARAKQVPMLVGKGSSIMGLSWSNLFCISYLPWKHRALKEQIKKEIKMQIETAQTVVSRAMEIAGKHGIPCGQKKIRIDSHQHTHMIPVVWEALIEVIEEEHYEVEYIRNAKEMLGAFLTETSLWKTYRPINFIKNMLLAQYSHKVDRYAKAHNLGLMYMWGLIMSGHMDYDRIVRLYPKITAKASRDDRALEIVFHPGLTLPEEMSEELSGKAARDFYMHEDRGIDKEALLKASKLFHLVP